MKHFVYPQTKEIYLEKGEVHVQMAVVVHVLIPNFKIVYFCPILWLYENRTQVQI